MKMFWQYLAVGGAGAAGAMSRYFLATWCGRLFGTAFPIGTFLVNVLGSFVLGWFLASFGDRLALSQTLRLAIGVGFIGAFTTFSSLMVESTSLMQEGAFIKAAVNLLGSLAIGLLAVRLGMALALRP